jgi:alanine dehydrogenase
LPAAEGGIRTVDAARVEAALPYGPLIEALARAFVAGGGAPVRHHHDFERPGQPDGVLLLMPAWQAGEAVGVKLATLAPGNEARGLPLVQAVYVLFDGTDGRPLALLDATRLTERRTACASALAAGRLARRDSRHLVMVGAGALAPHLVRAHATVRPIRRVTVWNRTEEKALRLAAALAREGLEAGTTRELEAAVAEADIVSCATTSPLPLVRGAWLRPGTHLDLVGAYKPGLRECDDEAVRRARVFVDTRGGALAEAGDIIQAIAGGALTEDGILADLFELCRGEHPGRESESDITLFKSVGHALEDLAAARLVVESLGAAPCG